MQGGGNLVGYCDISNATFLSRLNSVLTVPRAHTHTTRIRPPTSLNCSKVQTGVTCCTLCVFKALLLHGSLPEDEQDVSLSLDQGNAEQQVVVIVSPFVFSFLDPFF